MSDGGVVGRYTCLTGGGGALHVSDGRWWGVSEADAE